MPLSCCPSGFQSVSEYVGEEEDDEDEDEHDPDAIYPGPDAFLANELDPDDDVGLYAEDDDGFISDEDLEDSEDEDWDEGWGQGEANDYQMNLLSFHVTPVSTAIH